MGLKIPQRSTPSMTDNSTFWEYGWNLVGEDCYTLALTCVIKQPPPPKASHSCLKRLDPLAVILIVN